MIKPVNSYVVKECYDQYIILDDDKKVIDGMSSWWSGKKINK